MNLHGLKTELNSDWSRPKTVLKNVIIAFSTISIYVMINDIKNDIDYINLLVKVIY